MKTYFMHYNFVRVTPAMQLRTVRALLDGLAESGRRVTGVRYGGQVDLTEEVRFDLRVREAILVRAETRGERFRRGLTSLEERQP